MYSGDPSRFVCQMYIRGVLCWVGGQFHPAERSAGLPPYFEVEQLYDVRDDRSPMQKRLRPDQIDIDTLSDDEWLGIECAAYDSRGFWDYEHVVYDWREYEAFQRLSNGG